jgi:hypothetical protein
MTLFLRPSQRAGLVPAMLILLVLAAGCSSDPGPSRRGGPAGARAKPPTPMAGQDTFFDGLILAEIHVGTDGMPEIAPDGSGPGSGGEGRRRRGGSSGRMSVAGGTGGFGGNVAGGVPFGEGGRPARDFGGAPGTGPRPMMGGGRPVMIHLRFTNQGTAPVELHITDFLSPFGNFVVRPAKLTLEPGQSLETEPMSSQLAGAFSEVTATLRLRLDGRAEKKSFPLKAMPAPTAQAPNPPKS